MLAVNVCACPAVDQLFERFYLTAMSCLLQLFANSDIGNLTKKPEVGEPPKDYLQTVFGETPPVQTERTR